MAPKHPHHHHHHHSDSPDPDGDRPHVRILDSGPIYSDPPAASVLVALANVDPNRSRDVIVQVFDWSTCPPTEIPTEASLCDVVDSADNDPLFFTIPPQSLLTVRALPSDPIRIYEVRVYPNDPVNVLVNSWGLNADGGPILGTVVLGRNMIPPNPVRLATPTPPPDL